MVRPADAGLFGGAAVAAENEECCEVLDTWVCKGDSPTLVVGLCLGYVSMGST